MIDMLFFALAFGGLLLGIQGCFDARKGLRDHQDLASSPRADVSSFHVSGDTE